jgi:hypothetical protein
MCVLRIGEVGVSRQQTWGASRVKGHYSMGVMAAAQSFPTPRCALEKMMILYFQNSFEVLVRVSPIPTLVLKSHTDHGLGRGHHFSQLFFSFVIQKFYPPAVRSCSWARAGDESINTEFGPEGADAKQLWRRH